MCSQITEEADTNNYVEPHSGVMIKLIRVDTNSQPTVNKDKNQLTMNEDKKIAAGHWKPRTHVVPRPTSCVDQGLLKGVLDN